MRNITAGSNSLSIAVLVLALCSCSGAERWTPPDNPDPEEIRRGADEDAREERYELASRKYVWYFENALEHEPALAGVRVSFALMGWRSLAEQYPPALEEMMRARDKAEDRVRSAASNSNSTEIEHLFAFQDAASLNNIFDENGRTVELFKWLSENKQDVAHLVYAIAQDALVEAGEYALCETYLTGGNSFEGVLRDHRQQLEYAETYSGNADDSANVDWMFELFARRTAYIVAILVNRDRLSDARAIADSAMQELEDEVHKNQIEDALRGIPPERLM